MVRVLKFIKGKTLNDLSVWKSDHFFQAGKFAAKMDLALKSFNHSAYKTRNSIWFLSSIPQVADFVGSIKNEEHKKMILDIIDTFGKEVIPIQDKLEKGIIHGDINEQVRTVCS